MNQLGGGIFQAFSAGSHPASAPHPLTLKVLNSQGSTHPIYPAKTCCSISTSTLKNGFHFYAV
ncbi:hypothetical protein M8494_36420 [Serratia ureilytica]